MDYTKPGACTAAWRRLARSGWAALALTLFCLGTAARAVETDCLVRDPSTISKSGNTYWMYGTGTGIPQFSSTDRIHWAYQGQVFGSAPPWVASAVPGNTNNNAWAPDIHFFSGTWHLYYCYSTLGSKVSGIGVATNPTLSPGGWTDRGPVVTTGSSTSYNALDPCIFQDAGGGTWLSFGSYFSGIKLIQIDPATGKQSAGNRTVYTLAQHTQASNNSVEASTVYYHNGFYYLFVNWDACCNGSKSTYNIRVGRASSVTGPYYDKNGTNLTQGGGSAFLGSVYDAGTGAAFDDEVGPGHAGILSDTDGDFLSCHYEWARDRQGSTTVNLLKLTWDSDGWPRVPPYNGPYGIVSGMTFTLSCQHSGYTLDDPNGSTTPGTTLRQWYFNGYSAQRFRADDMGDGFYRLTNEASGLCLDDPGGSTTPGVTVGLWNDNALDTQRWKVEPTGQGFYKLTCRRNGLCLDDLGGSTTVGSNIGQYNDNGLDTQRWKMPVQPDGSGIVSGATYKLTNVQSGLCLDDSGGSLNAGTAVEQWTDNGQEPQHWKIEATGSGTYILTCQRNAFCLDNPNGSTTPGTKLQLWYANTSPAQQWRIERQADGTYKLTNVAANLCLDDPAGSTSPGTIMQLGTDNGMAPQRWRLTRL